MQHTRDPNEMLGHPLLKTSVTEPSVPEEAVSIKLDQSSLSFNIPEDTSWYQAQSEIPSTTSHAAEDIRQQGITATIFDLTEQLLPGVVETDKLDLSAEAIEQRLPKPLQDSTPRDIEIPTMFADSGAHTMVREFPRGSDPLANLTDYVQLYDAIPSLRPSELNSAIQPPVLRRAAVGSASYLSQVRDELIRIRQPNKAGFTDVHGYVVDYRGNQPETLGEATLHTAIAVIALATDYYSPDAWERTASNQAIETYLTALLNTSWGNRDKRGIEHPIRHPDVFDYDKDGKKLRNSPLTKDSFGAIMAATYYAYTCPNTSQNVRNLAKAVVTRWAEYLILTSWRTHSEYITDFNEFEYETIQVIEDGQPKDKLVYKHLFSTDQGANTTDNTGRKSYKGIEAFTLLPHELYALQNVATSVGLPAFGWDTWTGGGLESTVSQAIIDFGAPFLADAAARGLIKILDLLELSFDYSIPLGDPAWKLGTVKGEFSVGIPTGVKTAVTKTFRDAIIDLIREFTRTNTIFSRGNALLTLAVDRVLSLLPNELNEGLWRSVLMTAIKEIMGWLDGTLWIEAATYIATLQILKKDSKPDVVSYTAWSFAASLEVRPLLATMVTPAIKEFMAFLGSDNNPNGLWAWLAHDNGQIDEQLNLFTNSNDVNRWSKFAYGSTKFNVWKTEPADPNVTSPRIDYLVLRGLDEKGPPKSILATANNWFVVFRDAVITAMNDFIAWVKRTFQQTGQYVIDFINYAGQTVVNIWQQGNIFIQNVFEQGNLIRRYIAELDGIVEQWIWDISGALKRHTRWAKGLLDGTAIDRIYLKLREVGGALKIWEWTENGAMKSFRHWAESTIKGGAQAVHLLEKQVREASGKLTKWLYDGAGVFLDKVVWAISTPGGAAEAVHLLERQVREASGKLTRWLYDGAGVFLDKVVWAISTPGGAAEAIHTLEHLVREASGELLRWRYNGNDVFLEFTHWWNSTLGGAAKAEDVIVNRLREETGEMREWLYERGHVLKQYIKWRISTVKGAAESVHVLEMEIRDASGELREWLFDGHSRVFKRFRRWIRSTPDGAASASDMVELIIRHANGVLEKWLFNAAGEVEKYLKWAKSTISGAAEAADLVMRAVLQADGRLIVDIWDAAGNLVTQIYDAAGRLIETIGGITIKIDWPPKW